MEEMDDEEEEEEETDEEEEEDSENEEEKTDVEEVVDMEVNHEMDINDVPGGPGGRPIKPFAELKTSARLAMAKEVTDKVAEIA